MNFGEDSIVYSHCKVHHVFSVITTVMFFRVQSSTVLNLTSLDQCQFRSLYLKTKSLYVFEQVVVQPPWMAEWKMNILNDKILLMCSPNFKLRIDTNQSTLNKWLWILKSWFCLWLAILIMSPRCYKPSYAIGLKEYQLSIMSAVMGLTEDRN